MYGKCTTHLIRLCGVVHTLNEVIRLIKDFPDASNNSEITNRFKADLVNARGAFQSNCTITIEDVRQAEGLLNYFNFIELFWPITNSTKLKSQEAIYFMK